MTADFRVFPAFDGETQYTPEAVAGLVGQMFEIKTPERQFLAEALAAKVDRQGWVVVTVATPSALADDKPDPARLAGS
jgi:hypothetical protein